MGRWILILLALGADSQAQFPTTFGIRASYSAQKTIYLTSGTSWLVPANWNSSNNSIQCIGGGGRGFASAAAGAAGGGGGGYSKSVNVTLTPSSTVTYAIGLGGSGTTANDGGSTYLCNSTSNCASIAGTAVVVGAKGGTGATGGTGAAGASITGAIGNSLTRAGGNGGDKGPGDAGGGGGGAGGPGGAGQAGAIGSTANNGGGGGGGNGGGTAGSAGAVSGGAGGNGSLGTGGGAGGTASGGISGTSGGGGGGGGASSAGGNGGSGADITATIGGGGGGGGGGYNVGAGGNGGTFGGGGGGAARNGTAGDGGTGICVINYTATTPGIVPPSYIQRVETVWNTSPASLTTSSFNVEAGDVLVAYVGAENGNAMTVGVSGGSLTWTLQKSIVIDLNWPMVYVYTAVVDSNKTMTATFTRSGTTQKYGGGVLTFRNSGGVGASTKTNVSGGAPTLNITTTQANSAIAVFNADWNAVDGSSRTWRTNAGALTETTYSYTSGVYTFYGGYHGNAGTAGTYAVGLSAPGAQKYGIIAVEILGQ